MAIPAISPPGYVYMWISFHRLMTPITEFIGLSGAGAGKTDKGNRAILTALRPMTGDTGYSFFIVQRQTLRCFHIIGDNNAYRMLTGIIPMAVPADKVDISIILQFAVLFILRFIPVTPQAIAFSIMKGLGPPGNL